MEELKNLLLAGIGAAAYTYDKASELIENLVKRGQLTVDQGRELSEELKRNLKDTGAKCDKKEKALTREDMVELFKEMNFATKNEVEEIKLRLLNLEKKSDLDK